MDPAFYRTHTVSRGLRYHYFLANAEAGQPTLLLLHGFPSSSYDWHRQVVFFRTQGYGVLVPDLLGYGGTAHPEDIQAYALSQQAQDIVDILQAEHLERVISVSHDWCSALASRLANYFPQCFSAFAFLAVGYFPPSPDFKIETALELTKSLFGYELYGYQVFLSRESSDVLLEKNWDSAFSLLFPADPLMWKTDMGPVGKMDDWIAKDKRGALPPYLTEKEAATLRANHRSNGMAGPLSWYKMALSGVMAADDKLPPAAYDVAQPVFFGAAAQDYLCPPALQSALTSKHCRGLTDKSRKTYDGDHWIIFSHADEINRDLLEWIESLDLSV